MQWIWIMREWKKVASICGILEMSRGNLCWICRLTIFSTFKFNYIRKKGNQTRLNPSCIKLFTSLRKLFHILLWTRSSQNFFMPSLIILIYTRKKSREKLSVYLTFPTRTFIIIFQHIFLLTAVAVAPWASSKEIANDISMKFVTLTMYTCKTKMKKNFQWESTFFVLFLSRFEVWRRGTCNMMLAWKWN